MSALPIKSLFTQEVTRQELIDSYERVRNKSEEVCLRLCMDDYQIQSILETSPPKWHLAHVTWFFETFVLKDFIPGYLPCNATYNYLFNSYYQTIGAMQPVGRATAFRCPTFDVCECRA